MASDIHPVALGSVVCTGVCLFASVLAPDWTEARRERSTSSVSGSSEERVGDSQGRTTTTN